MQYDERKHGYSARWLARPEHAYFHRTVPEKPFYRPIPIAEVSENVKPFSLPQSPYISCETKRGWFGATLYPSYPHDFQRVQLFDSNGQNCGSLYPHTDEDISLFPQPESGDALMIEVAAICLQKRQLVLGDEGYIGGLEVRYGDFYGVLWIEWAKGVAHRKGSGYVEKGKWEKHDISDVHLVLG